MNILVLLIIAALLPKEPVARESLNPLILTFVEALRKLLLKEMSLILSTK